MVGGIIMTHGDDKGLILPPRLAPVQVIIVPIWNKESDKASVLAMVEQVEQILRAAGIRTRSDRTEQNTAGWKFNEWEMKGVPLRVEIGPKDVQKNAVVLARRDRPGKEGKAFGIPVAEVAVQARQWLDDIQATLLQRAIQFRDENIIHVADWEHFQSVVTRNQWARVWWAGSDEQERTIKEQTGATLRCFPLQQPAGGGTCFYTGEAAEQVALFARAY